jgi:hypothetical protein
MLHLFKPLLLAALFLFVQFAAQAHGVEHVLEPAHEEVPACELCIAYNPLGAGIVGSLPDWHAPMLGFVFNAQIPRTSPVAFRATYQSRAPPLTC